MCRQEEFETTIEQYRSYKLRCKEQEDTLVRVRKELEQAQGNERGSRKEVIRLTLENDELKERSQYLETKCKQLRRELGRFDEENEQIKREMRQKESQIEHLEEQLERRTKSEKDKISRLAALEERVAQTAQSRTVSGGGAIGTSEHNLVGSSKTAA